jgi:hypothetical protein
MSVSGRLVTHIRRFGYRESIRSSEALGPSRGGTTELMNLDIHLRHPRLGRSVLVVGAPPSSSSNGQVRHRWVVENHGRVPSRNRREHHSRDWIGDIVERAQTREVARVLFLIFPEVVIKNG